MVVASDVYEIEYANDGWLSRIIRGIGVIFVNITSPGDGSANPGGRKVMLVNRSNGETVLGFTEELGDDGGHAIRSLQADLESMTLAEFESKWID